MWSGKNLASIAWRVGYIVTSYKSYKGNRIHHAECNNVTFVTLFSFFDLSRTEQFILRSAYRRLEAEFSICVRQRHPSLRGPFDITFHNQIRLIYFLERPRFLADCHGKRAQSHRATVELI